MSEKSAAVQAAEPQSAEPQSTKAQFMRLALEIGPLIAFFIANARLGIFIGTAIFMAATAIAIVISLMREKRLPLMPIISCGFVMLFGGLTLWMEDATFIKIKPTVVNLLFAAILLIGVAVGRHPMKLVMGSVLELTAEGWRTLTLRWGLFFIVLAALNEVVWRNVSTDTWVTFKLAGLMPLSIAFGMAQIPLIMRCAIDTPGPTGATGATGATGGDGRGEDANGSDSAR